MAEQETNNPTTETKPAQHETSSAAVSLGLFGGMKAWLFEEGPWWLCSFVFHVVLVCSLALVGGKVAEKIVDEAPSFDEATIERNPEVPTEIERFDVGETPEDPTELSTDTLSLEQPAAVAIEEASSEGSGAAEQGGGIAAESNQPNLGGLGGFDLKAFGAGPAVKGRGGVGVGVGTGTHAGAGGEGWGFSGRSAAGKKAMLGSSGGTRHSERAVAAALSWIARHQSLDGSWSLSTYPNRCKDDTCSGATKDGYESGATAMALLPFLGAGQTHESKGPYKKNIRAGISYLINHQGKDGDLRMGKTMYAHGLAAIVLCETYGMSGDKTVGRAAQLALNFIADSQDPIGGGWRYNPRDPGDTSVVGWQVMALKSGQMAYLNVNPLVFERAKAFLKSASSGTSGSMGFGGRFTYMPDGGPTTPMTAVGLLCCQYMGLRRTDPAMVEGTTALMTDQPNPEARNMYYWYYATQVMHNQPGPDWDIWNRKMRRLLIDSQVKDDTCAAGSWDPRFPSSDAWAEAGGRLYTTCLAALTLEVYYRYLPLYKMDTESAVTTEKAKPAAEKAKPEEPAVEQSAAEPLAAEKADDATPADEDPPKP